MGLAVIAAMLALSPDAPARADVVPSDQRIEYVNQLVDRVHGSNAWKHYRDAIDAFVFPGESDEEKTDPEREAAVYEVTLNTHKLQLAPTWSTQHAEIIERWLEANEDALNLIKKGARYSRCFIPLDAADGRLDYAAKLNPPLEVLSLSGLIGLKASDCARRHDWKEAFQWNARLRRMAGHLLQSPSRGPTDLGTILARSADEQFLALLHRHYPDDAPALLERARANDKHRCPAAVIDEVNALRTVDQIEVWHEWAEHPTRHPDLAESIIRWKGESGRQPPEDVFRAPPHKTVDDLRAAIRACSVERELAVARKVDTLRREWGASPFHQAWRQRDAFFTRYCDALFEAPSLSTNGCSIADAYMEAWHREMTRLHATAVDCVVAIREFRKKEGHLPTSLSDLIPDFAKAPYIDSFSGKPFVYHVTEGGGDFVLYSVNWNQRDDGGRHQRGLDIEGDYVFWPPPVPKIIEWKP